LERYEKMVICRDIKRGRDVKRGGGCDPSPPGDHEWQDIILSCKNPVSSGAKIGIEEWKKLDSGRQKQEEK